LTRQGLPEKDRGVKISGELASYRAINQPRIFAKFSKLFFRIPRTATITSGPKSVAMSTPEGAAELANERN
jgi:hypothetical protein